MKILMLTPYVPYPPSSGGQIRTFNLLKYLSQNNQITLVCLYKNNEEKKYIQNLYQYCREIYPCKRAEKPWQIKNIIKTIFSPLPFLIVRNFSNEAKKTIEFLLKNEKFDVIHAETFYIMPHLPSTKIPIILVEQTIEYRVYQHFVNSLFFLFRPFFYFDILKLKYWERFYWKKANIVAAVSKNDEENIKKLEPYLKTVIIPNGAGDEMIVKTLPKKNLKKPNLLFQGNFYWLQNLEAANFLIQKIYPLLKKMIPETKLIISGQKASKIKAKKNIKIINLDLNQTKMVKKIYQKATIFIAPIFSPGGTRLKILAAMAAGIPVVSTKTGVEGLAVKDKVNVLLAETPHDFVKKIKLLLTNKNLYQKIQKNAYQLIKNHYHWSVIAQKLEKIYEEMI
jgi:glycosyltransferase involved in cell wall biosynthesis